MPLHSGRGPGPKQNDDWGRGDGEDASQPATHADVSGLSDSLLSSALAVNHLGHRVIDAGIGWPTMR